METYVAPPPTDWCFFRPLNYIEFLWHRRANLFLPGDCDWRGVGQEMCHGCRGDSCLCRRLRDAALSRNGRVEKINREYTSMVCVWGIASLCRHRETHILVHTCKQSHPHLLWRTSKEKRRLLQWQMGEGCKPAEICFCNLNLFATEFTVDRRVCGPL